MAPDGREEKPEGISKYLERMKSVLRPRSSRRESLANVAPENTYDTFFSPDIMHNLVHALT